MRLAKIPVLVSNHQVRPTNAYIHCGHPSTFCYGKHHIELNHCSWNQIYSVSLLSIIMRVAVIGAGPSGLVTLKYLLEAHRYFTTEPIDAQLFEAEAEIGGTFRQRSYEDAEVRRPKLPLRTRLTVKARLVETIDDLLRFPQAVGTRFLTNRRLRTIS